ncbi:iron ABC transporter permease [Nisaea acidiphila]|uniref:Iron ABC transporter permease n=1 Tax=Nisaea acidiphila TaxID=1862145 RepID=A0A9J7AXV8_9PROT|nr:iron ABC transporter permease [Nisaea acidiphila]UUX51092.1 iron ABC transporter permease [Nisaea acidiphila]
MVAIPASGRGNATRITALHLASGLLAAALLLPILAVFLTAMGDSEGLWAHLASTVLPLYVWNTLLLMAGVTVVSLGFGVGSAWLVARYAFPGSRVLEWALLLPAAVPGYLIAYTYTDFLEYAGPVQASLRSLFGWSSARDYWFPEIRSMYGASLVLGAVLYPYVYMMARTAFLQTPASMMEAGQLARRNLFWSIALPLARPAIIAGLALVLMETISDFGTVEYFAIQTLTLGIFNVWLGMNNLSAAAQIACVAFVLILALLALETVARSRRRFADTSRRQLAASPVPLQGRRALFCFLACALPVTIGFVIPVAVLLSFVLKGYSLDLTGGAGAAAINSLGVALLVAFLVMAAATFLGLASAYGGGSHLRRLTAVASIGYAFPGTILAVGVVTTAGYLDGGIARISDGLFGISYSGWLTSGVGLVVLACVVRFQAVGRGAVASGLERVPPHLVEAGRMLGQTLSGSLVKIVTPLIRSSVAAGAVLVFVDVMKELPMTLLLRPFNFETLATYVYQYAKDELLEEAALPALLIVAAGILPVIVLSRAISASRPGCRRPA